LPKRDVRTQNSHVKTLMKLTPKRSDINKTSIVAVVVADIVVFNKPLDFVVDIVVVNLPLS